MNYWFVFCKDDLLLKRQSDGSWNVPFQEEPPVALKPWTTVHNITPALSGEAVKTYRVEQPVTGIDGYEMTGLRKSYQLLPYDTYLKAGKCAEILYWDSNTKFCGVCGGPMRLHTDISKRCTCCGKEVWPQLATAVICLVRRGDEALLVHARNFKSDFYGLVAGFVETGETLEEAVEREVLEETGIRIRDIRYFASQPWPYPCGLMVGFFAEYAGGEIHLQRSELSRGGWFKSDSLPTIPEKLSIARRLIDHWRENLT
ncbi:MAG: NAD(+) diphosphatase [Prevotella sp.]|nr:NAD(+) diphosphatase [Prevotella sp.]MBR6441878.1 NAD(+) diphosphatase [Bacteroidales bacterium]